ncbi:MAG: aspartate aminotransferase family protein [Myxococcales bacterium]|nr:aspartate aminotransferase family protein [Myxococcales bacterium]MCB9629828.1 aspartate aminotransferase family protein [Sandaracinaceae bacterium]
MPEPRDDARSPIISDVIPAHGYDKQQVLAQMESFRHRDADWHKGRTWSLVYSAGDEHSAFLKQAHNLFFSENGLNPMAFKSLKRFETDTVAALVKLLHGPETAVGTLNSGGTESILLAMHTYRERSRRTKPWVRTPEVVLPTTAHPAFDKAAHYFGIRLRKAPIGPDFRVDVAALRRLINRNTAAVVVSAPHYCQGVVDPVEEVAAITRAKSIPLHVDACVGGLMLPWVERLGWPVPLWDFRVDGVTSISADLHKYGYAAKGASVVLYRSMDYLKDQFFVATDWPGGVYASANIPGTRPGGPIAAAWATLMAIGEDGYLELTRQALDVREKLIAGVRATPGVHVMGEPVGTLVTFGSDDEKALPIFAVADLLAEKGWHLDRHQNPNCIHATCSAGNVQSVDEFVEDMQWAVSEVRANPALAEQGDAAMYGMMAKVPARGLVKYTVRRVMEAMYAPGAVEPDLQGVTSSDPVLRKLDEYGSLVLGAVGKARERVEKALGR